MWGKAAAVSCAAFLLALLLGAGSAPAVAAAPPTLKVEVIGVGTVTGTGIDCGAGNLTCYSAYGSSPAVTLTATAGSGWTFDHWEDDCGPATCSFPAISGLIAIIGNVAEREHPEKDAAGTKLEGEEEPGAKCPTGRRFSHNQ